jgi:hypothetical protein
VLPSYWTTFVAQHRLAGREFSVPWPAGDPDDDLTHQIGVMSEERADAEATQLWPGVKVFPDGFVPVGADLVGTGDQYFINTNDGPGGPLYQIDHEKVYDDGYDSNDAISVVLTNYEELLNYVTSGESDAGAQQF